MLSNVGVPSVVWLKSQPLSWMKLLANPSISPVKTAPGLSCSTPPCVLNVSPPLLVPPHTVRLDRQPAAARAAPVRDRWVVVDGGAVEFDMNAGRIEDCQLIARRMDRVVAVRHQALSWTERDRLDVGQGKRTRVQRILDVCERHRLTVKVELIVVHIVGHD